MATVEYDLDCSGGLMEQIQKLVAPPESEIPQRKRRAREYRRQGRSVNHDCCDSCKEGGDLICCDRCPAAFHLQCHDPPLDEDELPHGEWLCHRCKVNPIPQPEPVPDDEDAMSTCSSHSRKSGSSSLRRQALSSSCSQRSHTSSPSPLPLMDMMELPSDSDSEDDEPKHPLLKLAKAARLLNPRQMELAKQVGCHIQLPGSSKRKWPHSGRGSHKKQAHELDNGIVPLPAKLCFLCSKSCRKGPLIQCDYCPLLFHMDCLNPPATTLPSGRWMCPNHVEHALDEKLLKSVRLSDRIKLWDKYTGPVNHHAVKIQFLNKIHRPNPPFRIKVHHRREKRVSVPAAIKAQYAHRASALPRATDVQQMGAGAIPGSMPVSTSHTTAEEQEQWLSAVVSLQTNIARHLAQQQQQLSREAAGGLAASSTSSSSSNLGPLATSKPTASVQPVKQERTDTASGVPPPTDHAGKAGGVASSSCTVGTGGGSTAKDQETKVAVVNGSLTGPASSQDMLGSSPASLSTTTSTSTTPTGSKPNGPVSLLQSGPQTVACATNGDLDPSKAASLGSSHKLGVGSTASSVARSSTSCSTSPATTVVSGGSSSSAGVASRNIVISTVNRTAGIAATAKVAAATPASGAKGLGSSTSILSPRVGSSVGTAKVTASGTAKVTVVSGGATNSSGSKVITVTTPGQAKSVGSTLQTKTITPASLSSSPAIINLNNTLQACIDGTGEVELGKLDERLVRILAWQRLQQLLPPHKNTPQTQPSKKVTQNTVSIHPGGSTEVRARALLCPLTGKGQPVAMSYRSLTIGTGGDMDVCLTQFGHCNFVSPKHASIFYDETTRHYELLNYSEHGTTVDNVLYSCDFSEKAPSPPQPPTSVVHSVRRLIERARGRQPAEEDVAAAAAAAASPPSSAGGPARSPPSRPFMCAHANEVRHTCSCKASSSSLIGGSGAGWEGTALLHHGSYIKVGCLQFVFSIVEQAVRDPCVDKKPAGTSLLKATLRSPSFSS